MKENKYDNLEFFNKYKTMDRSTGGLESSGEWHEFKKLLPNLENKRVLDLGCGFGWHLRYAIEEGASHGIGIDISKRMIDVAKEKTSSNEIDYLLMPIEDMDFPNNSFDIVISSLSFHYIKSFKDVCLKINKSLISKGDFIFSIEHPIFTANGSQDWYYDDAGVPVHWPVDRYFEEGERTTNFLGENVLKYHRTLTTYVDTLIECGFLIKKIVEPKPAESLMHIEGMKNELRRPMMLIISSQKI